MPSPCASPRRGAVALAVALLIVVAALLMHAPLASATASPATAAPGSSASPPPHAAGHASPELGDRRIAACATCREDAGEPHSAGADCLLFLVIGVFALAVAAHAARSGHDRPGQLRVRSGARRTRSPRPPPSLWELCIIRT